VTNAVKTIPDQVATYVKSTIHNWFGRAAVKSRSTRSGGLSALGSDFVVTNCLPRRTPCRPASRISRSMVQRAATMFSRRSWCHTLATYKPRPIFGSECTRLISTSNAPSLIERADAARDLAA